MSPGLLGSVTVLLSIIVTMAATPFRHLKPIAMEVSAVEASQLIERNAQQPPQCGQFPLQDGRFGPEQDLGLNS